MKRATSKYHQVTDEYLMQQMASGNRDCFAILYQRYGQRMHAYFYRMLYQNTEKAEDFSQELFLKLIEKPKLFRPSGCFRTWIYTIASNMVKNEYRRLGRQPDFCLLNDVQIPSAGPAFGDELDRKVLASQLAKAINTLEEPHRSCFVLRYQQELSIREISQILACPEGTIKSRLHYATKKLGSLLQAVSSNYL